MISLAEGNNFVILHPESPKRTVITEKVFRQGSNKCPHEAGRLAEKTVYINNNVRNRRN